MPRKKSTTPKSKSPKRQSRRNASADLANDNTAEPDDVVMEEPQQQEQEQQQLDVESTMQSSTVSPSQTSTLQRTLVGGPLLGKRPVSISGGNKLVGWDTFEPIITPEIPEDGTSGSGGQRFILLPHTRYISVLSYQTGVKVATLIPSLNSNHHDDDDNSVNDENNVLIASVAVAKYRHKLPESTVQNMLKRMEEDDTENVNAAVVSPNQTVDELVLIVGCRDGSIREFSLKDLVSHGHVTTNTDCGPYRVQGPSFRPRRVVRIQNSSCPILHLTVPHLTTAVRDEGILTYVVREMGKEKGSISLEVTRLMIPHFDESSSHVVLSTLEGDSSAVRSIDTFNCRVHKSDAGNIDSTLPFKMLSAGRLSISDNNVSQGNNRFSIFVVLAKSDSVTIYFEMLDSSETFKPIRFNMPSKNPLTAIDIGLNKSDITCGHYRGNIRVLNSALENVEKYHNAVSIEKRLGEEGTSLITPKPPQAETICSRVHWHALPVSSLVYDSMSYPMDPLLYSGGDESVLVTWQIAQGRDRPVDVQPRLALGGIVHVASSDRCDDNATNGILVYCDDNTLQLMTSHNKGQIWKVQGLAGMLEDDDSNPKAPSVEVDPRSSMDKESPLVITGLSQAPGYIHWFNPSNERLDASLEVIPFNRISRNEPEELPLPTPSIVCHAFSESGSDLITIDECPTENVFVGSYEESEKNQHYGIVSTIRFWTWVDSSVATDADVPYDQIASMTFPHGPKNRVSAIGISRDGSVACTVSFHEKAFRVWQKVPPLSKAVERVGDRPAHTWTCRYKVTTPSGFSNHPTHKNGVSFSKDGSILAISFGQFVTLWDTEEARMLTSFSHMFGTAPIDSVRFVDVGLYQDLLLVQSRGGVAVRSPYSLDGSTASFDAWVYDASNGWNVSSAEVVESHASVAVALYSGSENQSRIVILDAESGEPALGGNNTILSPVDGIDGCIVSLCSTGKRPKVSNWDRTGASSQVTELCLYGLSSTGHLYVFSNKVNNNTSVELMNGGSRYYTQQGMPPSGPRLEMIQPTSSQDNNNNNNKRHRLNYEMLDASPPYKKKALEMFGFGSSNDGTYQPSTFDLPSLSSSNFVRSFVGRGLSRKSIQQ